MANLANLPYGVNQPRMQKKRIAWEMEKSYVKSSRKAIFLDEMPLKKSGEVIRKEPIPIQAGTSLLKTLVPSSGNNSLLKTFKESKENSKFPEFSNMQPKKRGRPLGSTKFLASQNRMNSGNQSKDIRFARFKKNLRMTNNRTMLKFTHNYSERSPRKSLTSSSTSNSSDSTDSNQPIPIHFKCKDIEFTKITFTDELEKEKKKMEKAKQKLEQEKIKMRQIREEQIKAHQETSNNSIKSLESSKSPFEESQENSEEEQNSETEQKSDIKPRLIQRISYQGYMLEYLDLMEKRMAALSQSTNALSQGLDELWFQKGFEDSYFQPTHPRMKQDKVIPNKEALRRPYLQKEPSKQQFLCRIPFQALSRSLVRDLKSAKSKSRTQY